MSLVIDPSTVEILYDAFGKVRFIYHKANYYTSSLIKDVDAKGLARQYLNDAADLYEFDPSFISRIDEPIGKTINSQPSFLQFSGKKTHGNRTLISYQQTHFGIPVWGGGFIVLIENNPLSVVISSSSIHRDISLDQPSATAEYLPGNSSVNSLLDDLMASLDLKDITITSENLYVYLFDSPSRYICPSGIHTISSQITIKIPTLPSGFKLDTHFVVNEVLFTTILDMGDTVEKIHWRMFVEVETGTILHLRPLITGAIGRVFRADPTTLSGDKAIGFISSPDKYEQYSSLEPLDRLIPSVNGIQILTGDLVSISDIRRPFIPPPQEPSPPAEFNYCLSNIIGGCSQSSDNNGAVNAYFHCNDMFKMLCDHIDTIHGYFGCNPFPIKVDHRSSSTYLGCQSGNCRGAYTHPNGSTSIDHLGFMLFEPNNPVSMAIDSRVSYHELSHVLTIYLINDLYLPFSHSFGDSLAAIRFDPESNLRDDEIIRFTTFPFWTGDRKHGRPVDENYKWGGIKDLGPLRDEIDPNTGQSIKVDDYGSEQILATTLFRVYQALGGDDDNLSLRRNASDYLLHLIIRSLFSISKSSNHQSLTPVEYAYYLIDADAWKLANPIPDSCGRKVLEWSFRRQLAKFSDSQLDGNGNVISDKPPVDVYIFDGRSPNGEYDYKPFISQTTGLTRIWNRYSPDGGTYNQIPKQDGSTNYAYVAIHNRGYQTAVNVRVRGYQCKQSSGLYFPDDWVEMTPIDLTVDIDNNPITIEPDGNRVVGPFSWVPSQDEFDYMCMIVDADDDRSIPYEEFGRLRPFTNVLRWSAERLVPLDNNIAMRKSNILGIIELLFKWLYLWIILPFIIVLGFVIIIVIS